MTQLRFTEKATKGSLRERNDALVLQCVAQGQHARTDVVRETGLPAATVSAIVPNLIARRIVREAGHAVSRGGKPRMLLELDDTHHRFIGVHIGRGRVTVSRSTLTGRVEYRTTADVDPGAEMSTVVELVRRLQASDGAVTAVGVSVPGIVGADGVIREAVNFGWHDVPLATELSRECGVPAHVINDADAIALSEVARFDETDTNMLLLWIGVGIGAGIVLDGRLHHGADFRSGEIGHVDVGVPEVCRCGLTGCLETVAAIPSIVGDADESVVDRFAAGVDDETTADLRARVELAARELARAMSMLTGALDVSDLVMGGPVTSHPVGPRLLTAVNAVLAGRVMSGFAPFSLRFSAFGEDSAVVGAVAHAIRQEFGVTLTMAAGEDRSRSA
ncbi:MAG TPA: ROK family protein [Actinokineospora sp.]|jgi:predicted NBD/HSP70 family sugar kinase|nr:ROK family protein [Actinokineospora sp.]